VILLNNAAALGAKLAQHRAHHPLEDVVAFLDSRGVNRGYGDFWQAYALTFLTQERVIIEPLNSNLNPRYAPLVKAAHRVALVGDGATVLAERGHLKTIETTIINDISVEILERSPVPNYGASEEN
jgi:hypothetical protein